MAKLLSMSIRTHMIILIVIMTIAPLGIIAYSASSQRKHDIRQSYLLMEGVANEISNDQSVVLSGTEQLLSTLAYIPSVHKRAAREVHLLLAELNRKNPQITNILLAGRTGLVWASAVPLRGETMAGDRRYFRNALATGRFSSGEYMIEKVLNKPAIGFGYPIKDGFGSITDIAVAAFTLDKYEQLFRLKNPAESTSLVITDHEGTILFAPATPELTGTKDGLFKNMAEGPDGGTFEAVGNTGIRRLLAYRKLRLAEEQAPYMYVRAGVPLDAVLNKTRSAFSFYVGMMSLIMLVTLGLAVSISKRGILDKIVALRDAARKVARGNLNVRVSDHVSGGEMDELGRAFDDMTLALIKDKSVRKQAEEELRKKTEELDQYFHLGLDLFSISDNEGHFRRLNPSWEESLGYSLNELERSSYFDFIHPDDLDATRQAIAALSAGKPVLNFVNRLRCKDGSYRTIEWRSAAAGRNIYSAARDITERKQMEEALENRLLSLTMPVEDLSGISFGDLFNIEAIQRIQDGFAAATGVASIITDTQGRPLTRPSNFCHLCENIIRRTDKGLANCRRSDAVLGRKNLDGPIMQPCLSGGLWDGGAAILVGDHHIANWLVGQVLDESCDLESMMTYAREIGADEEEYRKALDSVTRMSKEQFSNVCQALFIIAGQLSILAIQNINQGRYIYERKLAEESLLHAKEYTENLIQGANAIIVGLDMEGHVNLFNRTAEEITGYSFAEIRGKNWLETVVPKDLLQEVNQEFERLRKNDAGDSLENPILTKKGDRLTISWRNNPIIEKGEVVGTISFGIDITEQRKMEEQLRHSLKMESIGRLAGGVAHDFNNMLSVIIGWAHLSKMTIKEEDPLWKNLNEISKAAQRSSDITRQLLAFSRKEIISPKTVNLNELIIDTEKTLSRLIGEDIILTFKHTAAPWTIRIDPSQVDQILVNLAINARDAMPGGGKLTIETANCRVDETYANYHIDARPGEFVRLTVSDSGVGMDKDTLEHIFEPFFTTKEVGKGTGLGLSTVYGIVTQNLGFVSVYSESGLGTTFKLYFPRHLDGPIDVATVAEEIHPGSGTVLLVEDDTLVRTVTTATLEKIGFTVIQAESPQTAISICKQKDRQIDLIISDVVMPEMNGREMIGIIHSICPGIKVLFMSGYTADLVAQRGVVGEGVYFIQKPFDMNALNQKIKEVLG